MAFHWNIWGIEKRGESEYVGADANFKGQI